MKWNGVIKALMIKCNQLEDRAKDRELTKRQTTKTKKQQRKGIERKHQQLHYMAKIYSCLNSSSATQREARHKHKKNF